MGIFKMLWVYVMHFSSYREIQCIFKTALDFTIQISNALDCRMEFYGTWGFVIELDSELKKKMGPRAQTVPGPQQVPELMFFLCASS